MVDPIPALSEGTVLRTADLRSRHANRSLAVATATTTPRHAAPTAPGPATPGDSLAAPHAARADRCAPARRHIVPPDHNPRQQIVTVPAKVDGPFHMSLSGCE
jgi:hypothetical protein